MKLYAVLILTLVLLVSSLNNVTTAQVTDSNQKTNLPDKAFYFYFINGYAFAYKFNYSENSDLRLHVDFSSAYSDSKDNRESSNSSDPNKSETEENATSSINNISAEFAYSYNFYRSPLGQAYVGTGPFISYGRNKHEHTYSNNNGSTQTSDQTYTSLSYGFSAGLSGFIGMEAFLSNNLRVFAEAQLTGGRNWSKYENTDEYNYTSISQKQTSNSSGTSGTWFYNLTTVRIGIGISL